MSIHTINYGNQNISFEKSTKYVAVNSKGISNEALRADLASAGLASFVFDEFVLVEADSLPTDYDTGLDILRANPNVSFGTHVYNTGSDDSYFVPNGEIFARVKSGSQVGDIENVFMANSLIISSNRGPTDFILRITKNSPNPMKVCSQLQSTGLFNVVEPELSSPPKLNTFQQPDDEFLLKQWHLKNHGEHFGTSIGFKIGADANVIDAWNELQSLGSSGITIAIIDDGFDLSHPDIKNLNTVNAWDFKRNTQDVSPLLKNKEWHGTACAGVAIGEANGLGIVGVAPGCSFMPIRWGKSLKDAEIENWFDYVRTMGADIVSCSWSARARNYPLSTRKYEAIEECASNGRNGLGCVICFAADNYNRNVNDAANNSVNGFANHPNVIAVSAITSKDEKADYSSFGDTISVCAPSSGAGGWAITTSDVTGSIILNDVNIPAGYSDTDYTSDFGGTSSACPLVAGVCALLLTAKIDLASSEVKGIIQSTARKIGSHNDYQNNHNIYYGFGCVDAHAAIVKTLTLTS